MPLEAMAQTRPCFFTVAKSPAPSSSTDVQPSALELAQSLSELHFSARPVKHHEQADCLMRPLRTTFSAGAGPGSAAKAGKVEAAPKATADVSSSRRFTAVIGGLRSVSGKRLRIRGAVKENVSEPAAAVCQNTP